MSPPDQRSSWLKAALQLTGSQEPFPWQKRLLAHFLKGDIPSALDIPTGLGKTSVLAIWLVALALSRQSGQRLPLRLVYVVDRRAIVDQATAVAEDLRHWLDHDGRAVRDALGLQGSLPISTLRGQFIDNRQWLENPASPAIVIGTVDMIGSRLLFSGYGVSRRMRPFQAGLLGIDSLIVLDESHLVPPFHRLLQRMATGHDADGRPLGVAAGMPAVLPPMLKVLSLSATGIKGSSEGTFQLDASDLAHPVVAQRLNAVKRLEIKTVITTKSLAEVLADAAWNFAGKQKEPVRIIIFVNRRTDALDVQKRLEQLKSSDKALSEIQLFVGGRRNHERAEAASWLKNQGFLAGYPHHPDQHIFLIATSAGEVGVDLDADHAFCDVVAWERMVQRFGRVNRRGARDATITLITISDAAVAPKHAKAPEEASPPNDSAAITDAEVPEAGATAEPDQRPEIVLSLLKLLPQSNDGSPNACPAHLTALQRDPQYQQQIQQATTPAWVHPPLTRALVDAWSMTSLRRHTGRPEVGPWIRGWPDEDEPPQCTVIWRRLLPVQDNGKPLRQKDFEAYLSAAPPHLAEQLELDARLVADWLLKRDKKLKREPTPDDTQQGHAVLRDPDAPLPPDGVLGILTGGVDDSPKVVDRNYLMSCERKDIVWSLNGATLILDCRIGGLNPSGLLDAESDDPVLDVTASPATAPIVPYRIRYQTAGEEAKTEVNSGNQSSWRLERRIVVNRDEERVLAWLVIESDPASLAETEDARSSARFAQLLEDHQTWTEERAQRIAESLLSHGPPEFRTMLTTAARLHDEGKRAPRWQQAFGGPADGKNPIAKSARAPNTHLLDGYRHELGSLPRAEKHERFHGLPKEVQDLCLHLIVAHHGNARPTIETRGTEETPSNLTQRAQAIALRFVALQRSWGPWGLAYWETLLRAADQQASRAINESEQPHG